MAERFSGQRVSRRASCFRELSLLRGEVCSPKTAMAPLLHLPASHCAFFRPMTHGRLDFRVEAQATDSRARAATFRTAHNEVRTPLFMPVGTQATVKGQLTQALEDAGSQILLANTYHLLLRPGPGGLPPHRRHPRFHELEKLGAHGLRRLPDFLAAALARDDARRARRSKATSMAGTILLSPEVSIETQKAIGSDIMMVLDQCIPSTADEATARAALEITQRWAARSLAARGDSPQAMFAIVQGALFPELRRRKRGGAHASCRSMDLRSADSPSAKAEASARTPASSPRSCSRTIARATSWASARRSISSRRCIAAWTCSTASSPRRSRSAAALSPRAAFCSCGAAFTNFPTPRSIPLCACPTCARYSRAYLHHLTKTGEHLGWQLLGQHNLYFYHQLMRDIRQSIFEDRFLALYREKRAFLHESDADHPIHKQKPRTRRWRSIAGTTRCTRAPEGFASIRQISSGEIMHSRTPPMEEAQRLYIEQSELASRVRLSSHDAVAEAESAAPLVIWDVGLGAAANAMAAILCYEAQAPPGRCGRCTGQLRKRSRSAAPRLPAQPRVYLPAASGDRRHPRAGPLAILAPSRPELDAGAGRFSRNHRRRRRRRRT